MSTAWADTDDGLFGADTLLVEREPLRLPQNILGLQEQAETFAALIGLWMEWRAERHAIARPYSWDELRALGPDHSWSPSMCGPPFDPAACSSEAPGVRCVPALVSVDVRCSPFAHDKAACSCVGGLLYRHGCTWCGHLDNARDRENTAVEDAMDHRWPTWRDLPVLACAMPDEKAKRATWLTAAVEAYPPGWIESGGPIRTARGALGGRHVAGRTPFGGYDLGADVVNGPYLNHVYRPGLYSPADPTPAKPKSRSARKPKTTEAP